VVAETKRLRMKNNFHFLSPVQALTTSHGGFGRLLPRPTERSRRTQSHNCNVSLFISTNWCPPLINKINKF
jgi:hypothetical protein